MGCSFSSLQRDRVGAPRPNSPPTESEDSQEKETIERSRELHLLMCVEPGKVPKIVHETIAREVRSTSPQSDDAPGATSTSASSAFSSVGSHPMSPLSSCNSQLEYANPNQTIIILDWDDTLCPSTYLRRTAQFNTQGHFALKLDQKTRGELQMLADQVLPLLKDVLSMGKVVLVTNARRPWVSISCNNFLPSLKEAMQKIAIIYALELVKPKENLGKVLLTETKACAMKAAVSEFYSRYPRQSWKNIISIGDALFEHNAIRQVVSERPKKEKCRTKTIKLLENPTIAGMIVQLSLVKDWMNKIIHVDGDVDIDLSADEETVNNWVRWFGNGNAH